MNKLIVATLIAAAAATVPARAADINVAVTIGQPGYYGRIEIGNYPPPIVINQQPIIIQSSPVYATQPLYLRVPPGHQKKWAKHCARYSACGQPVYFVQDRWYNEVYAPRYRSERGHDDHERYDREGRGRGKHHGEGRGRRDD